MTAKYWKFLVIALGVSVSLAASANEENQHQERFELGVGLMLSNNCFDAIDIFQSLYAKTYSPRVKLEWARCHFILGNYNQAEELFNQVKSDSPPPQVIDKIDEYLNSIKSRTKPLSLKLSIAYDHNPFLQPEVEEIIIYGIPFSYTPSKPKKPMAGVRLFGEYRKELHFLYDFNTSVIVDHTQYSENSELHKTKYGVRSNLQVQKKAHFNLGIEYFNYYEKGQLIQKGTEYNLSGSLYPNIENNANSGYFVKIGDYRFPSANTFNNRLYSIGADKIFASSDFVLQPSVVLTTTDSLLKQDSYNSIKLGLDLSNSNVSLYGAIPSFHISGSQKIHKSMDTLFLETRSDNAFELSMNLDLPPISNGHEIL